MNTNRAQSRAAARRLGAGLLVVALLAAAPSARAGSEERKGTGGAFELRLPVGPRGTALGGAGSSDVSGVEAIFWNPAGLASVERVEAMFSNTRYFADQKLNYAAMGVRLGQVGVLGLNAKILSIGDVIVTTEDAPEGTGEILQPTFAVLGLTFARQFTDRVAFGATANYVSERVIDNGAGGVAFDFGIQYSTGYHGMKLGMAMKNFGPQMQFTGPGFEISTLPPGADPSSANRTFRATSAAFEMPSFFTLAASYDVISDAHQRLALVGAFQNNNFQGDHVAGGVEWGYQNQYFLRGSYFGSFRGRFDATTQSEEDVSLKSGDDLYSGYALGAGAALKVGDTSRLAVDFAWRPVREFFDDTVEFGIKYRF